MGMDTAFSDFRRRAAGQDADSPDSGILRSFEDWFGVLPGVWNHWSGSDRVQQVSVCLL